MFEKLSAMLKEGIIPSALEEDLAWQGIFQMRKAGLWYGSHRQQFLALFSPYVRARLAEIQFAEHSLNVGNVFDEIEALRSDADPANPHDRTQYLSLSVAALKALHVAIVQGHLAPTDVADLIRRYRFSEDAAWKRFADVLSTMELVNPTSLPG